MSGRGKSRRDPQNQIELLAPPGQPSPWIHPERLGALAEEKGVIAVIGEGGIVELGWYIAAWRLSRRDRVVYVDGSRRWDPYRIKAIAKQLGREPGRFLKRLSLRRAANSRQIDQMVTDRVLNEARRGLAGAIILSGILEPLLAEKMEAGEARRLVNLMVKAARQMAAVVPRVFFLCSSGGGANSSELERLLSAQADRLFRLQAWELGPAEAAGDPSGSGPGAESINSKSATPKERKRR